MWVLCVGRTDYRTKIIRMKKNHIFAIMLFVFVVNIIESISYLTAYVLLRPSGVYFDPGDAPAYSTVVQYWNADLGWPSPQHLRPPFRDKSGARMNPFFPTLTGSCLSVYGESATYGADVADSMAWSNQLSKKLDCRVSNFAVNGYGSDQALMYFRRNVADQSGVVMLGMIAPGIFRNVNQFRPLMPYKPGPNHQLAALKPRFIINETQELQKIPIPLSPLSPQSYQALLKSPASFLHHEYFQIDEPHNISRLSFPYTLSMFKGFDHFLVRESFQGKRSYEDLYNMDHPSRALPLAVKIFETFEQEAISQGRTPLILLLPTAKELQAVAAGKDWLMRPLINQLDERGIRYLNVGDSVRQLIGERDPCELFIQCLEHPNEEMSVLIAEIIYQYLKSEHIISVDSTVASGGYPGSS